MSRQEIAYLLIALIVAALAAVIAWRVYSSRDRVIGRQRNRELTRRKERARSEETDGR